MGGNGKQNKCYLSIYIMTTFSDKHVFILDPYMGAPVYGKGVADGMDGRDNINPKGNMQCLGGYKIIMCQLLI